MKKYLVIIAWGISAIIAHGQDNFLGNSRVINDSIKAHLEGLYLRTMNPRWDFFKTVDKYGINSKEARRKELEMIRNDSTLLSEVLLIYDNYGWPKLSQVDTIASAWAANQIVHADIETQRRFLPIFFKGLLNGDILGESFALLTDKLLMLTGEAQIYGTQNIGYTYANGERKTILWPVENFNAINDLRKSLGMNSIQESLEFDNSIYDPKVTVKMVRTN